ncbi:hypothetical protein GCM10010331_75160 [Streptomyces xanthochromogenes]|uniref:RNA polymerase sigma factor n=1 Tax=Streptomyces xanthochromogenes TaxID=67384 RepID=UPI0016798F96|nr:sigma-70 family RNA polymerase sigma factor [Streptomyces xanthochromogenes]GHB76232.1 hypothetical protein GCM10010331_75160 [Streptomyces xanthochromogenes]
MSEPKRWRKKPEQELHTLGEPSPSLSPKERKQWEKVRANEKALRRIARAFATAEHENAVFAAATAGLLTKLENSGPVEGNVLTYITKILRHEAGAHRKKIAEQQQRVHLVGDDIHLLDTVDSVTPEDLVVLKEIKESLKEKLPLLRKEFSEQEYKVFLLTEGEGMNCREISEALGGISPGAVRQSLLAARQKLKRPAVRTRLGVSPLAD